MNDGIMIVMVEDMMEIEPSDIANENIYLQSQEIVKLVNWLSLKEDDGAIKDR